MEMVTIYQVIWASYDDPLAPSVFCSLDIKECQLIEAEWLNQCNDEEDCVYLQAVTVPIPEHLFSKFHIGT